MGAVDGHNQVQLEEVLHRAKAYRGPALIHIKTQKGHGYGPAEEDSTRWHGVAPNGSVKKKAPSYTQVFGQTLVKEMGRSRVVAITAAMPDGTGLAEASRTFPQRVFDVGIAEQHAVTFGAGLAADGMHAGGCHLLHLPAARVRPGDPRRVHPEAAHAARPGQRRPGGR